MEVLSITLKNFKAHRDSFYEFCPGTNAICGENGAGKTSIFEAIAWVLFDHCDYTKKEIVAAGAKSAQVTVTFVSTEDSRVYEVRRCTSQGYSLHDPQLNANLGLKKLEDVTQWLCEHLGVPPTTELDKLFAETIGIPQGTFTVDFLKRPADRKKVFDPILKVEEYKQAYSKSRDLEAYAQGQVRDLERSIAVYDQQLTDWPDLRQQAAQLRQDIDQDQVQIALLTQQLEQQKSEVDRLTTIDKTLQTLSTQVQQCKAQTTHKQEALLLLEQSWESAQKAVVLCRQHRPSYQAYEKAQEALQAFAVQRQQQQQLLKRRDQIWKKLSKKQVEQSQLQGQLASFRQMRADLEQWKHKIPIQEKLEQSQVGYRQQIQVLDNVKLQVRTLQSQLQQCQVSQKKLSQEITQLQRLEVQVKKLPVLETQRQKLLGYISRVEAAKQFSAEFRQLVEQLEPDCDRYRQKVKLALKHLKQEAIDLPSISEALEAGINLTSSMLEQLLQTLTDLSDPEAAQKFQTQLQQIQDEMQVAQQAQVQWSSLGSKELQKQDLEHEISEIQQQSINLEAQLKQESVLTKDLKEIEQKLVNLNNPRGQVQVLQQQLLQEDPLQAKRAQLEHDCQELQHSSAELEQNLDAFKELENQAAAQQKIQRENYEVYQIYLRHRNEANTFKQLDKAKGDEIATLNKLQQQLEVARQQYEEQSKDHDPQQLIQATAIYQKHKSQQDQLQGGLPPKQAQFQALEQQLQSRQKVFEQRQQALQDQGPKQEILQLVREARRVYNQSGPRITKLYLTEISWEADNLFRELLNRPDVALRWTEDYDIQVQSQGYWRSFRSLSGGDQMCALNSAC